MDILFTYDIPRYCSFHYSESAAFYRKIGRRWQSISYKDYSASIDILSLGLLTLGINKNENVATIFSYNCPQWNILDMALAQIGAVNVPVYPTNSDSDYLFILNQTEVRYVIATDQCIYNKLSRLQKEIPHLEKIFTVEELPNVDKYDELIQLGLGAGHEIRLLLEERMGINQPSDVVTIVYTSGSTGFPKGAMLTHKNLVSNMMAAAEIQPLGKGNRIMSFLPLCHVYERTANYQSQYKGASIYYCESLKAISKNIREVKPNGITVVPRFLEKVIRFVMVNTRKGNFLVRMIVYWAIHFGFRFKPYKKKHTLLYKIGYRLADLVVFRMVRTSFGGKLKYIGCGGAHISSKIERFFWAAKMPVYQGYGLTECSPLVALNYPGKGNYWIGSVGKIVKGMEVRIADDGEILCKGASVMKGYYKQDELTEKTIVDEWLHTGDIGTFERDKFLRITGRKKQMFKTSYGKYIVPQAIENKFIDSSVVDNLIIIGEGKHCAAAIISPNFTYIRKQFDRNNKLSNHRLIELDGVRKAIRKEIDAVNNTLGKTERIKKHLIVPDTWSVESGELSPTFKIKRNIILKKYKRQIHLLYRFDSV